MSEFKNFTQKAIREIPKTWQRFNESYLVRVTRQDILVLNILAVFVGLGSGMAAIGFRSLIGLGQNLLYKGETSHELIPTAEVMIGYWPFLFIPLALLIATLLTKYLAPEAKGHGVPEVIESVLVKGGRLRKRIVLVKAFASSVTIAAGGSVGREGPMVQIGSALGSSLGQWFGLKKPKLLKTLVGCGAAGAIAASFNTPIGGVIFAIEIIVLELKTKSFIPLVISAVFATMVCRFYDGNSPSFMVPEYSLVSNIEFAFYIGLAILSAIVGVIVIRSLYAMEGWADNLKIPFWLKPLLGGLCVAGFGYYFPQIYGVGYDSMTQVLQGDSTWKLMASLAVVKIIVTCLSLAFGGSGGVFAPSLFIGCMLGGAYGYMINTYFPDISASYGAYALVGMAAMFSATGRATFTAIVILFEMTLDYSIILPLMLVCVLADQISWAILPDSIYSKKLKNKGLEFVTDISVNVMGVTLLKDIMTTEIQTAKEQMTLSEFKKELFHKDHTIYPVVCDDGTVTGVIHQDTVAIALETQPMDIEIKEIMDPTFECSHPNDTVLMAIRKIGKKRDPRILITDRKTKQLVGIVSPIDFVRLSSADAEV